MEATARRSGWVTLVAILFLIGGGFNLIWGVIGLGVGLGGVDDAAMGDLSRGDLEGLGAAGVVIGALQLIAGIGIMQRSSGARVIGLVLAVIAVLLNFTYHHVLDGWAFSGLIVNAFIIIVLAVKAPEFR